MQPRDFPRHLDLLKARLEAAGVTAAVDPREVNPPCAWVMLDTLSPDRLCGEMTMTATVTLISPDIGHPSHLHILAELLASVHEAVGVEDVEPTTITTPDSGSPLPALQCRVTIGD